MMPIVRTSTTDAAAGGGELPVLRLAPAGPDEPGGGFARLLRGGTPLLTAADPALPADGLRLPPGGKPLPPEVATAPAKPPGTTGSRLSTVPGTDAEPVDLLDPPVGPVCIAIDTLPVVADAPVAGPDPTFTIGDGQQSSAPVDPALARMLGAPATAIASASPATAQPGVAPELAAPAVAVAGPAAAELSAAARDRRPVDPARTAGRATADSVTTVAVDTVPARPAPAAAVANPVAVPSIRDIAVPVAAGSEPEAPLAGRDAAMGGAGLPALVNARRGIAGDATLAVGGSRAEAEVQPPSTVTSGPVAAQGPSPSAPPPVAALPEPLATIRPPVTDSGFADALSERVLVMAGQKLGSAELRLNPVELGPLRVDIQVEDGAAKVTFTAQQPLTREAIEQALPRLRELLASEGLTLTGASVGDEAARHARDGGNPERTAPAFTDGDGDDEGAEPAARLAARETVGLIDTFA